MLDSQKTAILSLQIKHTAFPVIRVVHLSTSLEKSCTLSTLHNLIKTLYKVFLFKLAQCSLIIDSPEQLMLEECIHCIQLKHYVPYNRTRLNFPEKDICVTMSCVNYKQKKISSFWFYCRRKFMVAGTNREGGGESLWSSAWCYSRPVSWVCWNIWQCIYCSPGTRDWPLTGKLHWIELIKCSYGKYFLTKTGERSV